MTNRHGALLAALTMAFTIGCSSSSNSGNAAAGRTFTYGSSTTATSTQAGVLSESITQALRIGSSTNPAQDGMNAVNFQDVTATLLGPGLSGNAASDATSFSGALTKAQPSRAAIEDEFETCATMNADETEVTFNCTATDASSGLTMNLRGFIRVDEALSSATMTWNLTMTATMSSGGQAVNMTYTYSGALTATGETSGTVVGHMDASLTLSSGGYTFGMDENLTLDVEYADSCEYGVTGGTLEAKRVVTAWPSQAGDQRPDDAAAKITWTACGTATIQMGN